MDGTQTFSLIIGLPVLAIGINKLAHLPVARIACPRLIESISWVPFQLRLGFDQMPSKATLRPVAIASLLICSETTVIAIHTGVWQQIKTADPYYIHYVAVAHWLTYILPSPAGLRSAFLPLTENILDIQMRPQ